MAAVHGFPSERWDVSGPADRMSDVLHQRNTNEAARVESNSLTNEKSRPLSARNSHIDATARQSMADTKAGRQTADETRSNKKTTPISPFLDEDIPENMYLPDKDVPEGWIHRDKLAKIESEELQAAGINLANSRSRASSRLKVSREALRDIARTPSTTQDDRRSQMRSPIEIQEDDERSGWDIRLPEEIAAEAQAAQQMYSTPVLRKSGSRIPVLTSSPAPISSDRYERDTPISRKRAASGTISYDGDASTNKTKYAKDDSDSAPSVLDSSSRGSPTKSRSASMSLSPNAAEHRRTPSGGRKLSAAAAKNTTSPARRPSTRSGEHERPRPVTQKPESEPPWLATMYKPDPMLPPDQQIIPTLAKKQMQAQWESENAIPKTYNRDFEPIEVHDEKALRDSIPVPEKSPEKPSNTINEKSLPPNPSDTITTQPPPLQPLNINRLDDQVRPGTSGSITGSYSTMPKISNSAAINTTKEHTRPTNAPPPQRMQLQNFSEEKKEDKGCGCCVVM